MKLFSNHAYALYKHMKQIQSKNIRRHDPVLILLFKKSLNEAMIVQLQLCFWGFFSTCLRNVNVCACNVEQVEEPLNEGLDWEFLIKQNIFKCLS